MSSEHSSDLFLRGVAAARGNDKEQARFYLEWALREWDLYGESDYDKQADAYYWLSSISDDPQQKRNFLERAIASRPSHPEARRDLTILNGRLKPEDIVNPDRVNATVVPSATPTASEVRRYVCPQCGGKLAYDVANHALTCEYCGYQATEDEAQLAGAGVKSDFTATVYTARAHRWELATARTLTCQSCGASFTLPPAQVTGACPFCASAHVVESSAAQELIEPSGVVPFQFDFDAAVQHIRDWLKAQEFAPGDLYEKSSIVKPRPVYLPAWAFELGGEVRWRALVQERRESDGQLVWSYRDGNELVMQNDLLVLASHSLPAALASALTNPTSETEHGYDLKAVVPYSEDFLVDWPAEIYQIALADASLVAHQRAFHAGQKRMQYTTEAKGLSFDSTGIIINTYKLVLLPVWMSEYRYKDNRYPLAVNGQTGSVYGDVPRSGLQKLIAGILK